MTSDRSAGNRRWVLGRSVFYIAALGAAGKSIYESFERFTPFLLNITKATP